MITTVANRTRRNFLSVAAFYLLISTPIVLIGWSIWDAKINHGYYFGFYGEWNRMKSAITSMPDVRVVDCYFKEDRVIENVFFTVEIPSRHEVVHLNFREDDSIRRMEPKGIQAELRKRLALPLVRLGD